MKRLLTIFLLCSLRLLAQQPQTHTAPTVQENSKWTNGVAPGYAPTAGSGLTLNLSAGTAFCGGSVITYAGGTLSMTGSTTNNVYLDTASSCVPAVKTSAFAASDIPIAIVTTTSVITAISDLRTMFVPPGTAGGGVVVVASGTVTINPGATSSNTCSSAIDGGTATGVATTDNIQADFSADPTATTGYVPGAMGTIVKYPTADHVNFKYCNNTASSITPTSVTLNWRVMR